MNAESKSANLCSYPPVAVIILCYNARYWLPACLDSLLCSDYPNYKIVLVDNHSTDDTVSFIKSNYPQLMLIENDANAGFSAGNNLGLIHALQADTSYFLLLNPDTKVLPNCVTELVKAGERFPDCGILGGFQLTYDEVTLNDWTKAILSQNDQLLWQPPADVMATEWVEGACFMIKRAVIERIGLLDPIFFAFYEEIDYCRRARLCGFETMLVTTALIHHYRGGTWQSNSELTRRRNYQCDRSQYLYELTNPQSRGLRTVRAWLVTLLVKLKSALKRADWHECWQQFFLQAELLKQLPQILRKRQRDAALCRLHIG